MNECPYLLFGPVVCFTVVYISALENRAKELNIYDLKPFYSR